MEPLTKILTSSIELFRQYGFKSITMDDISRKAGISKKTLYQHFANKSEVVTETVTNYKNNISTQCCTAMEESDNAIEAMVKIMDVLDQINRQMNPLALFELERYFPDAYKKFKDSMMQDDVERLKENIQNGIAEGLYRPELDVEFMSRFRMELSLLMYHPNLMLSDRQDLQFVGHQISEHFLYGIMTQKGEKLYQKYKEQYIKQVSKI